MFVKLNPGWIKLALKFKDFPALSAIFNDFQGAYEPCIFLNPKNSFQAQVKSFSLYVFHSFMYFGHDCCCPHYLSSWE